MKKNMLKQRIITATLLVVFFITALFVLPPLFFVGFLTLILLYAAWEYSRLIGFRSKLKKIMYPALLFLMLIVSLWIPIKLILLISVFWWFWVTAMLVRYQRSNITIPFSIRFISGFLVLVPSWTAINVLLFSYQGQEFLLFLFVLVWLCDISAFFVGRKWGKRRIVSRISPNKTLEGMLGSLSIAFLLAILGCFTFQIETGYWLGFIGLSLLTGIFAIVGDLFESVLKRQQGIKESGHLLPGHGGLLDRIDSLTAAAPLFALGSIVFGFV